MEEDADPPLDAALFQQARRQDDRGAAHEAGGGRGGRRQGRRRQGCALRPALGHHRLRRLRQARPQGGQGAGRREGEEVQEAVRRSQEVGNAVHRDLVTGHVDVLPCADQPHEEVALKVLIEDLTEEEQV